MIFEVFDIDSVFYKEMMTIILESKVNVPTNENCQIHHIIPKCWFKHYNMDVDNSISNTVKLTWENHKKVHELAYRCAKEKWLKQSLAYACHRFGEKSIIFHHTEEAKKKISLKLKGRQVSDETRKKHSIASKGNKAFAGKHHTDETKEKLREKMTNRKITWGDKISKSKKGKKITYSKEGLERKRQATIKYNKTRKYTISEETRKKISDTLKGRIPWNKGIKMNKENS